MPKQGKNTTLFWITKEKQCENHCTFLSEREHFLTKSRSESLCTALLSHNLLEIPYCAHFQIYQASWLIKISIFGQQYIKAFINRHTVLVSLDLPHRPAVSTLDSPVLSIRSPMFQIHKFKYKMPSKQHKSQTCRPTHQNQIPFRAHFHFLGLTRFLRSRMRLHNSQTLGIGSK